MPAIEVAPVVELAKRAKFAVVNHYQVAFLVVPTVFFALATVTVGLRYHVRRMKKAKFTPDDYLCAIALLLGYAMIVLIFFLVYETGQGHTTAYVMEHHPEVLLLWVKTTFSLNMVWFAAVAVIQVSLLFFYIRLFHILEWVRYACYTLIGLVTCWYVSSMITWFNSCHPFPKFFNPALAGKCNVDSHKVCSATGFIHVGFDVLILIIPIPAIWKLKLPLKKRLAILGVLTLGIFGTICSIIRMACIMNFWVSDAKLDPVQGAWGPFIFQTVEVAVGIFCCCIPTLPPVFRRWRDQWNTSSLFSKVFKKSGATSSSGAASEHKLWVGKTIGGSGDRFIPLEDQESAKGNSTVGSKDITVTREYDVRV